MGTPDFRLLEIGTGTAAPAVTLRRLALGDGRIVGSIGVGGVPVAGAGGCLFLRNGALTVVDSDFEECAAVGIDNANGLPSDGWGGAIAASAGSLTIRGSSFSFNHATGGAALAAGRPGGSGQGGAIFAIGPLTALVIRDSSISGSSADRRRRRQRAAATAAAAGSPPSATGATLAGASFSANAAVRRRRRAAGPAAPGSAAAPPSKATTPHQSPTAS